jgi:hypothetical protein
MSSQFNYQINYGAGTVGVPPRIDPGAPLYASEDGVVASLSNSECIFQVKRSGETHVMTFQVLQALDQSREFRTLDEHVARIMATIPGLATQREGVVRVLESLAKRGLLVSDSEFLRRLTNAAAAEPEPLRAVFIRACDRPDRVELLLASLAGYGMAAARKRSWVHILGFVVITALVVYVILDMEHPRLGLITVTSADQSLVQLRKSLQ